MSIESMEYTVKETGNKNTNIVSKKVRAIKEGVGGSGRLGLAHIHY